jgi:hypothetical protein
MPSNSKLEKQRSPGPAAYNNQEMNSMSVIKTARHARNTFGIGDRDVHFAKYGSQNENIYSRGLI